jgi:hypothetical protein
MEPADIDDIRDELEEIILQQLVAIFIMHTDVANLPTSTGSLIKATHIFAGSYETKRPFFRGTTFLSEAQNRKMTKVSDLIHVKPNITVKSFTTNSKLKEEVIKYSYGYSKKLEN